MVTKGESEGERDILGVWDKQIQTTIHKIDKQQGFYCTAQGIIRYLIITYNGIYFSYIYN